MVFFQRQTIGKTVDFARSDNEKTTFIDRRLAASAVGRPSILSCINPAVMIETHSLQWKNMIFTLRNKVILCFSINYCDSCCNFF